ncbi:MAG: hypothetical protein AAF633_23005 [Chloroflexota bacterium]
MKVSIGFKLKKGPWGGGNQFGNALAEELESQGVEVSFDLKRPDLNIILLTEPRITSLSSAYTDKHILRYLYFTNRDAIVIHRINECDERKNSSTVNAQLIRANQCADHTVFVGGWLKPLFEGHGLYPKRTSVIHNGSDRSVFNPVGLERWDGTEPLKLVTHHWSGNWMKGFDIYQQLDKALAKPEWRDKVEFTYIGNLPNGFKFENSRYVPPKSGPELASELKQHHVYLTASINEPGGNHQNEGGNCGLPLLYRNSGCLPEYCEGFGIMFDESSFFEKLGEMRKAYATLAPKMESYPHTSKRTSTAYVDLFERLMAEKKEILAGRELFQRPNLWWRAITPINRTQQIRYKLRKLLK